VSVSAREYDRAIRRKIQFCHLASKGDDDDLTRLDGRLHGVNSSKSGRCNCKNLAAAENLIRLERFGLHTLNAPIIL
jgi:hypothetical protein